MLRIPISYNIRSLKERKISTLVTIICIAGVVAVFISVMSMANGFRETLKATGSENNVMVRRGGSSTEMESAVTLEQSKIISDTPGIKMDPMGHPLTSEEVVVIVPLKMKDTGNPINVQVRGVSDNVLKVRENVKVKKGRLFKSGLPELLVGKNVAYLYENLNYNDSVYFGGQLWTVVGILDAGGTAFDSEIWCDATVLNQVFKRPTNIFQSVNVKLSSKEHFRSFKDKLTTNPRLTVEVEKEIDYYSRQSKTVTNMIKILGYLVAFVMGIGAVFSALNTMYSSISGRAKEIAILRSVGFSRSNIILSFLAETMIIAIVGGILGCLISLPMNGISSSTINWANFAHVAFAFRITPYLIIKGIIFSIFMGFCGGFFPAVKAARQSIIKTLRGL